MNGTAMPSLTYDARSNMAYVRLSNAEVSGSEEVSPGLVIDYDEDGKIIAIEFQDAAAQLPADVLEKAG
ncbi:DUF2283 domain-containing protein [Mesorhizobium sp. CAU 1732]|uniref:DUF2283 domain-containing protein n=1 Tax=Mesorhizobium sp. CAU 1732 TaxID=3140358 RepID=UPI003260C94F